MVSHHDGHSPACVCIAWYGRLLLAELNIHPRQKNLGKKTPITNVWTTFIANIHPGKLTWNLKITQLKRKIIFQTSIFGFHVNFQRCIKRLDNIHLQISPKCHTPDTFFHSTELPSLGPNFLFPEKLRFPNSWYLCTIA